METVLQEATSTPTPAIPIQQGDGSQLDMLLDRITSPYVVRYKSIFFKGPLSRYFESFLWRPSYGSSVAKPKNNGLLWKKKAKGVILEQKGTRMAEDGEDWNGLEMTILNSLATFFKRHERWRSSFNLLMNNISILMCSTKTFSSNQAMSNETCRLRNVILNFCHVVEVDL